MSGLRFESMADMPPRMRELYARQQIDLSGAAAPAPLAKGSQGKPKYGSQKAERGTIRFDSQKEARRYDELMVMLRAGIISDLRLQHPRDPLHGGLFLPLRREAGGGGCQKRADADEGVSAQPEDDAIQVRDRYTGGVRLSGNKGSVHAAEGHALLCRWNRMRLRVPRMRVDGSRAGAAARASAGGGRGRPAAQARWKWKSAGRKRKLMDLWPAALP